MPTAFAPLLSLSAPKTPPFLRLRRTDLDLDLDPDLGLDLPKTIPGSI